MSYNTKKALDKLAKFDLIEPKNRLSKKISEKIGSEIKQEREENIKNVTSNLVQLEKKLNL